MRIGQLQSLTEDELSLLLYMVNVINPLSIPKLEITPERLLWYKHDWLIDSLIKCEPNLTATGKTICKDILYKLNRTAHQERKDYENTLHGELTQSEFQFDVH